MPDLAIGLVIDHNGFVRVNRTGGVHPFTTRLGGTDYTKSDGTILPASPLPKVGGCQLLAMDASP